MTFGEYVKQYVTLENALEYSKQRDQIAWVSDLTGLSVDHRFTTQIENRLDALGKEVL
jgi:hypothetical protein